jgi:hypothetical protein
MCRNQRPPFVLSPNRPLLWEYRVHASRANWKGFLRLSLVTVPSRFVRQLRYRREEAGQGSRSEEALDQASSKVGLGGVKRPVTPDSRYFVPKLRLISASVWLGSTASSRNVAYNCGFLQKHFAERSGAL